MTGGALPLSGDGGALLSAVDWLEGLITGPVATALAVLAIAATGLSMLSGRIPVRRGLTAAVGCFVLFGAPAIARGIVGSVMATGGSASAALPPDPPLPVQVVSPRQEPAQPAVADPYAGASVSR